MLGIFGSEFGAGKIFSGISDGGSIGAVGEGDGVGAGALACVSAAGTEELAGLGDDWAPIRMVAATAKSTHRERKILFTFASGAINRGDRIRTCDLLVPNQALYQAKLHPGALAVCCAMFSMSNQYAHPESAQSVTRDHRSSTILPNEKRKKIFPRQKLLALLSFAADTAASSPRPALCSLPPHVQERKNQSRHFQHLNLPAIARSVGALDQVSTFLSPDHDRDLSLDAVSGRPFICIVI